MTTTGRTDDAGRGTAPSGAPPSTGSCAPGPSGAGPAHGTHGAGPARGSHGVGRSRAAVVAPRPRSRPRRALVVGLAALAPALAALLAAGVPGEAARTGTSAGSAAADGRRSHEAAARPPAAPAAPNAPAAPETCEDGTPAAASLRPSDAAGEAVERVRQRGQLIVGVDQNNYLWGYRNPQTGSIDGFDIDLVQAIGRDLLGPDAKIVYRTIPTDQRIPAIRNREVDMVVRTMTINCERRKQVAFSTAYFVAGQQVLAPRASEITGHDSSLRNRRTCSAKGSTAAAAIREQGFGAEQVLVPNQLDCLVRLQLGEVDAVVTDSALAAGLAAQDPTVELVGEPFTTEPYGVAMNLEDEDLVRRVNKVLDDFRSGGADSAWRTSYDRWLADVMPDRKPRPPAPQYRD
ncbi:glutamate ABC transporter substrate-binding protein [Streptomyces sp. WMMC1477]|uniref:glutamate ABC transporter substrate-binding protein n=1 Tax=Streptomyces sp. WMMC1477 TaxID=3015155 RepID=UPI0022B60C02|nr:glutamate ABC transporter substrate-binding protein [Streptomyces sp. WMMC1477]MCZ7431271.1 glutamate ABC transporter substrate-binding protein [Streptomyces sp. WMMC1477]